MIDKNVIMSLVLKAMNICHDEGLLDAVISAVSTLTELDDEEKQQLHDVLAVSRARLYEQSEGIYWEIDRMLKAEGHDVPPIHSTSDAVEWSRAVRMARWILEADERYNTKRPSWWAVGECDRCKLAYCCDHLDECRTKDADGNWIYPCVAFMEKEGKE